MKKSNRNQVIQDEAAAETREGERQASIETARVLKVLQEAEEEAAKESTAVAAKQKFWGWLKAQFRDDGL